MNLSRIWDSPFWFTDDVQKKRLFRAIPLATVFKSIAWRMTSRTPQQRSPSATYNAADAAPTHETYLSLHSSFGFPVALSSTYFSQQQQNFLRGSGNYLEQPQKRFSRLTAKNSWMNWDFSVECQQERDERSLERPRKRIKSSAIKNKTCTESDS